MSYGGPPVLSLLILVPVLGALVVPFLNRRRSGLIKGWALTVSMVAAGLAVVMVVAFQSGSADIQWRERIPWLPALGISYHVGVDGISVLLVALTAFLTPVALLAAWREMEGRTKEYAVFLLLLEAGMIGAFVALDLALFFVFWEAMLIPLVLLIGVCGGQRRVYAAVKFFLYTAVGSLAMLLAIVGLAILHQGQTGQYSFDLAQLAGTRVPPDLALWMFLAFALAFAIKVPVFPLHAWLPDAYTQAPTAIMVLVTMMAKVGAYGLLRFGTTLFPEQMVAAAPVLLTLGVVGVLYASFIAVVQRDVVRLIAFSSIAHMAFIVLGIFSLNQQGIQGATLQMLNHSISTGGLFILAAMVNARTRTTGIAGLGGLAQRWPVMASLFTLVLFSSVGLPGLNGFVGEVLILMGTFQAQPVAAVVAGSGVVLAAVYLVWMYQRAMHGADAGAGRGMGDLSPRELLTLVPIVVMVVWIGLFPTTLLSKMEASVGAVVSRIESVSSGRQAEDPLSPWERVGVRADSVLSSQSSVLVSRR